MLVPERSHCRPLHCRPLLCCLSSFQLPASGLEDLGAISHVYERSDYWSGGVRQRWSKGLKGRTQDQSEKKDGELKKSVDIYCEKGFGRPRSDRDNALEPQRGNTTSQKD